MPCRLLVILGAGASYDCTSGDVPDRHDDYRPPLVTQLFEGRPTFTRILHQYALAEQAAADIRPVLSNGSVAIEAFLKDRLRDSEYEHDRRKYWAIPLYLQHLLFDISMWDYDSGRGYTAQPDSYDRLINAALRVDEVTFMTLNYDDLFDRRLFIHGTLESMQSYLGPGQKWALIKLHGSINWGRIVLNTPPQVAPTDPVLAQTFANLGANIEVDSDISLRLQPDIRQVRSDEEPFRLYYPALSVPLGTEDELVCPDQHVNYIKDITGHYEPLDVLVIGYSGLDQEALNLMSWGGRPIRSLSIVSESEPTAQATADRITAKLNVVPAKGQNAVTLFETGFTNFAHGSDLDDYIERIRAVAAGEDERRTALGYQ
jgi:hypothetical protein